MVQGREAYIASPIDINDEGRWTIEHIPIGSEKIIPGTGRADVTLRILLVFTNGTLTNEFRNLNLNSKPNLGKNLPVGAQSMDDVTVRRSTMSHSDPASGC